MRQQAVLDTLARDFRAPWTELPDQVAQLREKLTRSRTRGRQAAGRARGILGGRSDRAQVDVDGISVVAGQLTVTDKGDLRSGRRPAARQARFGRGGARRRDRRQTEPDRVGNRGCDRQGHQGGRSGARIGGAYRRHGWWTARSGGSWRQGRERPRARRWPVCRELVRMLLASKS